MSVATLRAGWVITTCCIIFPTQALAQEQVPLAMQDNGTIVVTALKRSERPLDIPVSLSVLSAEGMARRHVSQADDLVQGIANMQSSATVGDNTPIFAIRGVSMSDFSLNQASPVALYQDEVYKGNFALMGIALYDMERVEVLRGPQGTLYGRNSTGGAVNLVSRLPLFRQEGHVSLGIGNFDRREAGAVYNSPLAPNLAVRIAMTAAGADGWFRNSISGARDLNGTREMAGRLSLLWDASPDMRMVLRLSASTQSPSNYGSLSTPGAYGTGAGVYEAFGAGTSYNRIGLSRRAIAANYTPRRRAHNQAASLTTTFDLARGLTLTSITAYDHGTLFIPEDTDGSPLQALEIPYTGRASQWSQELRLSADEAGGLRWIAGLYAIRENIYNATRMGFWRDLDVNGDGAMTAADCANAFPVACDIRNRFDQVKKSVAAYADVRLALSGRLALRGGVRLTRDVGLQRGLAAQAYGIDGMLVQDLIPATDTRFADNNLSGKVGAEWRFHDDALLFASAGRGYRGSSFNGQAFFDVAEATVARPERVDALEAGVKVDMADHRLIASATLFRYAYHDQQFLSVNPANAAQTVVNLDRSSIHGGELEISARPNSMIDMSLSLGLLQSRVVRGVVNGIDVRGNRLLLAPDVTAGLDAGLIVLDNDLHRLRIGMTANHVGNQFFEILNTPRLRQPGYTLVGGSIELRAGHSIVTLWGKNLTNRFYYTSRIDLSGFGFDYSHVGTPRTYGLTIRRSL